MPRRRPPKQPANLPRLPDRFFIQAGDLRFVTVQSVTVVEAEALPHASNPTVKNQTSAPVATPAPTRNGAGDKGVSRHGYLLNRHFLFNPTGALRLLRSRGRFVDLGATCRLLLFACWLRKPWENGSPGRNAA